jgi:sulfide dehydrogenase cytochrome subunit
MVRWLFPFGCALAFAIPSVAEVTRGETLALQCFGCHGFEGRSPGRIPKLDDSSEEIQEELEEFRTGQHESTIMDRIVRGYTDEEIRLLAEYFGSQHKSEE